MWDSGIAGLPRGERVLARKDGQYFLMSECATMTMYAKRNENSAAVQIEQRHAGEEEEHVDQRDVENEHDELGRPRIEQLLESRQREIRGKLRDQHAGRPPDSREHGLRKRRGKHGILERLRRKTPLADDKIEDDDQVGIHWLASPFSLNRAARTVAPPPGPGRVSVSPSRADVKSHAAVL